MEVRCRRRRRGTCISFLEQQPDLNFRNPEVVEAMHDVIRFWLERGADGFRIDVIANMIKDARAARQSDSRRGRSRHSRGTRRVRMDPLLQHTIRPEVHDIIRGFRRVSDSYEQRILVGETWPREHERLADYLRPDELQLAFNFRFLLARYDARRFRAAIEQTETSFGPRRGRPGRCRITISRGISRATRAMATARRARASRP